MTSAILEAILGLCLLVLFVAKFLKAGPLLKVNEVWSTLGSKVNFINKWWFNLIFIGIAIALISAPVMESKASKIGVSRDEYSKLESAGGLYGMTAEQYFEEGKKASKAGFENAASFIESKKMGIDNHVDYINAKKLNANNKNELDQHLQEMKKRNISSIEQYIVIIAKESQVKKEKELAAEQVKKENELATEQVKKGKELSSENDKSTWISLCSRYAAAKDSCAVAPNVSKCIDIKMGQRTANMGQNYCDGPTPRWSLPTPNWSLMGD